MSYRGHFMNEHSRFDRMVALSKSDQTQRKQQQQLSITGTQQKPESDVHENNNNTIDFNFPVAPYDVQLQLMHALYKAIDDRSVGLFESPTGTGKTLSIICATLTWLRRNRVSTLSSSLSSSLPSTNNGSSPGTVDTKGDGDGKCDNDDDDPPWVAEQTANRHATLARDVLRNRARAYNARVRAIKAPALRGAVGMDVRSAGMRGKELDEIDDLFGDLGDGSSDDGFGGGAYRGHGRRISTGSDVFRKKTQYGNARRFRRPHSQGFAAGEGGNLTLNGGAGARDTDKTGNQVRTCRIIFATRTHSQISQFVQEMRRTSFFSSLSSSSSSTTNNDYCSAAHPNATTSNPNSTTMNGGSDDIMFKLKLPGGTGVTEDDEPPITVFSFGSRKHMCVNDSVLALKSSSAIAERCQELTTSTTNSKTLDDDDVGSMSTINPNTSTSNQKRKRAAKSCAFHDADHEARVRDTLLAHTTPDIEDAVRIGRAVGGCPYYATRQAVADGDADVIMVPYAGVLHAATRKSLGLTIDSDTVVVFDEAHNVPGCVRELHSCTVQMSALITVRTALSTYMNRFVSRLSTGNLFKIRQVLAITKGLINIFVKYGVGVETINNSDITNNNNMRTKQQQQQQQQQRQQQQQQKHRQDQDRDHVNVVGAEQLVFDAGIDNVNFVDLVNFLQESRLFKKLRGYSTAPINTNPTQTHAQDLDSFERFIDCLCHAGDYARIAIYPNSSGGTGDPPSGARLRYFVVDASALFSCALRDARAILLVGGTLSPRTTLTSGLLRQLLANEDENNHDTCSTSASRSPRGRLLVEFECDHVVPPENVMARACTTGPTGQLLEFTHRHKPLRELHASICTIVKASCQGGGVVIFFASYDLLQAFVTTTGLCVRPTQRCEIHGRRVFREVRGDVSEQAWKEFQQEIRGNDGDDDGGEKSKTGAVLLAVMGGKLSEGINFSDDLGRVVVMVGMPFANARHPETAEMLKCVRLRNIKRKDAKISVSNGDAVLENECMTVVNQCVGRAVRHRKDYACIVFLDRRYSRPGVVRKMPRFIRRDVKAVGSVAQVCSDISAFFKRHP